MISHISGSQSLQDKKTLVAQMIRQDKALFTDALDSIGIHVQRRMSVDHAVQMASLLRLSTKKLRDVRKFLKNSGIGNFLPSEDKIRETQLNLTNYLKPEHFEMGKMLLQTKANDEKLQNKAYIKIESIETFLENIVANVNDFRQDQEFKNELWLLFAGDKGGAQMKFHVEIVNDKNSGSRDAVHPYCMFEALDSVSNMWKIYSSYREFLAELQKPDFRIGEKKVKVFLGGNNHFLSDSLGHQGQFSTYPSPVDLVTREHLQKRHGSPHSPETCNFELRTVKDYQENFIENKSADKGLHDDGKHHHSVVSGMLFPIASLDNVVPALLHIHLGIVLALFVMLEKECQSLDSESQSDKTNEKLIVQKNKVDEINEKIQTNQQEVMIKSSEYVDLSNILERISKTLVGAEHLDELAKALSSNKKANREYEQCYSDFCVISEYDVNVSWIECNANKQNKHWVHAICECLSDHESVNLDYTYACLKCSGHFDSSIYLKTKIDAVVLNIEQLKSEEIKLIARYDVIKSESINEMGPREKKLNTSLANMNVARQAYHSNSFVGNHCKTILNKYEELCECILGTENYEHFMEIFKIFTAPRHLLFKKSFLTDEEVLFVTSKCHEFGKYFSVNFKRNITPKMHEYIFTVPRFVKIHRTIGLLSEEEGESLHAALNMEFKNLVAVKESEVRLFLGLKRHALRNVSDKNLIKAHKRLCECSGHGRSVKRNFLINGKCPACNDNSSS